MHIVLVKLEFGPVQYMQPDLQTYDYVMSKQDSPSLPPSTRMEREVLKLPSSENPSATQIGKKT